MSPEGLEKTYIHFCNNAFAIHTVIIKLGNFIWGISFILKLLKGPPSGQRQYLTIDSPLKMMKNDFYFMLNAFFVLEIVTVLS